MNSDGGIVVGWLAKLAVGLGLLGLVAFDGIAVLSASFQAADQATIAAAAAADNYKSSHDVQVAYDAALAAVAGDNDTVETTTFRVAPDGHVTLRLRKVADTVWLQRIGPLDHLRHVSALGAGSPSQ